VLAVCDGKKNFEKGGAEAAAKGKRKRLGTDAMPGIEYWAVRCRYSDLPIVDADTKQAGSN